MRRRATTRTSTAIDSQGWPPQPAKMRRAACRVGLFIEGLLRQTRPLLLLSQLAFRSNIKKFWSFVRVIEEVFPVLLDGQGRYGRTRWRTLLMARMGPGALATIRVGCWSSRKGDTGEVSVMTTSKETASPGWTVPSRNATESEGSSVSLTVGNLSEMKGCPTGEPCPNDRPSP